MNKLIHKTRIIFKTSLLCLKEFTAQRDFKKLYSPRLGKFEVEVSLANFARTLIG